jgi:hypothetical protein
MDDGFASVFIRRARDETPTSSQIAASWIQVPEPRCWRAAGRCTDRRSHKQIFRGNVFSSQRPGAFDFFFLLTDLWIGKFSSCSRHHRPFSSLGDALRGGWGFPCCLSRLNWLFSEDRRAINELRLPVLSIVTPSRCIRSATASSPARKTATPQDQVGRQLHTIAAISLHSHHPPRHRDT